MVGDELDASQERSSRHRASASAAVPGLRSDRESCLVPYVMTPTSFDFVHLYSLSRGSKKGECRLRHATVVLAPASASSSNLQSHVFSASDGHLEHTRYEEAEADKPESHAIMPTWNGVRGVNTSSERLEGSIRGDAWPSC